MMLAPPNEEEQAVRSRREQLVDWSHLVGKRGTTTTRLTPSGKARFGDELIDVISDGELISAGTPVRVVAVRGSHVLVEAVNSSQDS